VLPTDETPNSPIGRNDLPLPFERQSIDGHRCAHTHGRGGGQRAVGPANGQKVQG
jgi:hypothetical protein